MKFISNNLKKPKLVFIDGLTRTGKSLLSGILPSLNHFEHIDFANNFELLMSSYYCKKTQFDYLKGHVHKYFLEKAYNKLISRSVNFRPSDQTGVKNYAFSNIYKSRLLKTEGDQILKELYKSKNYNLYQTHDMMLHIKTLDKLNLDLKILEIYRNPFDLTYGWIKKDLLNRFNNDERLWVYPKIKFSNNFYGIWYHNYIKKYFNIWKKLNNHEKSALMVAEMIKKSIFNQKNNKVKFSIKTMRYEEIIYDDNLIPKLEKFFKTSKTKFTKKFLKKMNIPRKSIEKDQKDKKNYLRDKMQNKYFLNLIKLEENYKKNIYGLKSK